MKTIKLTRGYETIVDDEDYERLMHPNGQQQEKRWMAAIDDKGRAYAKARWGPEGTVAHMSRIILKAPAGTQVDHKNRNTLDNRRGNLRIATRMQNNQNRIKRQGCSSKYKGVTYDDNTRGHKFWKVSITVDKSRVHLGRYETEEEAAFVYNEAAKEYFGEFALLNEVQ